MYKSKLISALKTLNKKEWFEFRKFLVMEVNVDSEIFRLFEFLQVRKNRFHVLKDTDHIQKEYFPEYPIKRFLNLNSKLYNIFEEWLMYFQFKQEKYDSELMLLKALNKRGLYKHANQVAKKIRKNIQNNATVDNDINWATARLNHYQYFSNNPIKYEDGFSILEQLICSHSDWVASQANLYLCELNNISKVQKRDITYLKSILFSKYNYNTSCQTVNITKDLYNLLEDPTVLKFNKLKSLLFSGKIKSHSEFNTLISLYILNVGFNLWTQNKLKNPKAILQLYNYIFENDILSQNGKIPIIRFHNTISTLGIFKNYEWNLTFINTWIKKVNTKWPTSTLNLAHAQLCFVHERYNQIIHLLNGIEYETDSQKIRSRSLEIIAMYMEKSDLSILHNLINNFKRLLKRNKNSMSEKLFLAHINLIKVIEKLVKKQYKNTTINLDDYEYLLYRKWCQQQITKPT